MDALNGIYLCKWDMVRASRAGDHAAIAGVVANQRSLSKQQACILSGDQSEVDHSQSVCPECGYRFKGRGFDGIDVHWRAKHETIMPYTDAWALIESGNYRSSDAR